MRGARLALAAIAWCVPGAMEATCPVPTAPAAIEVRGRGVFVRDRLPGGGLGDCHPLVVRGINWGPTSPCTLPQERHLEYARWSGTDLPRLAQMGVNVVRLYHDLGSGERLPEALRILDEFHALGLKVIVPVSSPRNGVCADADNLVAVVSGYRSHPAVLFWGIANEWDLPPYLCGEEADLHSAALRVEALAQQVHSIDPAHPVATFLADPHIPHLHPLSPEAFPFAPGRPYLSEIVEELLPSIDVFGFNLYRGASLQDATRMWASVSSKPMLVSEFGADAYNHCIGQEDGATQASFTTRLWDEVQLDLAGERVDGIALGALLFEAQDEWLKNGDACVQDESSERNAGQPDCVNDEDWFGAARLDRVPRPVSAAMSDRFARGSAAVAVSENPRVRALSKGQQVCCEPGFVDPAFDGVELQVDGRGAFHRAGGGEGGRGVVVGLLDPCTGVRLLETASFDTWYPYGGPHAGLGELVDYLQALPDGSLLLLAIGDEGGFVDEDCTPWAETVVEDAYRVLESLGSVLIRGVCYQDAWAMVAVKGEGAARAEASARRATGPAVAEAVLPLRPDRACRRRPTLVSGFYETILGRAPDDGGRAYWEGEERRVRRLGADVREVGSVVAGLFFGGAEYGRRARDDEDYVRDLYAAFLGREPEPGGVAFWSGELEHGARRGLVRLGFQFSAEFGERMTSLSCESEARPETYVVLDFYRGALDRLPDDDGYGYWVQRLRDAQCDPSDPLARGTREVEEISRLFFASEEYSARSRSDADYVGDLYYAFLRRYASLDEVGYWVEELRSGRRTRDGVRAAFLNAPEFRSRLDRVTRAGCLPCR